MNDQHTPDPRFLNHLRDLPDWHLNWAGRRRPAQSVAGQWDPALHQRLGSVAKGNPWAEYSLLTAALRVVLWRLGGAADLLIATPALHEETRRGPLLVRLALDPKGSFRALTRAQRDALAIARNGLATDRETFETAWRTNDGGDPTPLYRVVWQQAGLSTGAALPARFRFTWERDPEQSLLAVWVAEEAGGEDLARALATRLPIVLTNLLDNGDLPLTEIPLLGAGESPLIQAEQPRCFPATPVTGLLAAQAARHGAEPALHFEEHTLSYAAFSQRIEKVACSLQQQGVGRGSRVALWGRRHPDFVVAMWAVLRCGASWLALDPSYPQDRLNLMLADSGTCLVLGLPPSVSLTLPEGCSALPEIAPTAGAGRFEPAAIRAEDEAYVIYTSGSTGRPKGVPIHHGALTRYIQWAAATYRDQAADCAWFTTPAFDLTITSLFLPFTQGDALVVFGEAPTETLVAAVFADPRIDLVKLTPAHVALVPEHPPSSVARVILGGEALLPEQVRRLRAVNPAMRIFNEYGPTEATVGCTMQEITDPDQITIGRPADHAVIALLDAHDHPVPPGFHGSLHIGGEALTSGYLNRATLNSERFTQRPDGTRLYRAGDLASLDAAGNLHYHGRNDFQLKIRGYRIEAGEIESTLTNLEGVHEAVVIGAPGADGKPVLVAYVAGPGAAEETRLREAVAAALPLYMMPAFFVALPALPLTANGKVDRAALPAPQQARPGGTASNEGEAALVRAFAAAFPKQTVTTGADFFALGGDSIKALQISAFLHEAGYALEVGDLFREPRLRHVASGLRPLTEKRVFEPLQGAVPTTPAQSHFRRWFAGNRGAYNQSVLLDLPQPISDIGLRAVVRALQERHEVLRAIPHPQHPDQLLIRETYATPAWVDLRGSDTVRRDLQQRAAADQRDFDLEQGPLLRVTYFQCNDSDRLLVAAHHFIVDAVSWRLLLNELSRFLVQHHLGKPLKPSPRGASLDDLAAWLKTRFPADERRRRAAFWQAYAAGSQRIEPDSERPGSKKATRVAFLNHTWDTTQTQTMLGAAHRAFRTEINDLLLTALGDALWRAERLSRVQVLLESHGRDLGADAPDLSRTVAWFTTWFPVVLHHQDGDVRTRLTAVKENLRAVRHAGIDYSLLSAAGETDGPAPEMGFNYLGRFDADEEDPSRPRFSTWDIGPENDPSDPPPFAWFFSGMVVNDRLQLGLAYDQHRFHPERMARLHQSLIEAVDALVAATTHQPRVWLSPADVPLAALQASTLDQIQEHHELTDLYPLSPMQQGLLFHHNLDQDGSYVEQIAQVLRGRLDQNALTAALTRVLDDAEIGRTQFFPDAPGGALQGLLTRALTPTVQTVTPAEADAWMASDREQAFDLAAGPPLRVTLLALGEDRYRLVWTFHHMLMDGWCLPLLFSAVIDHYRRLRRGERIHSKPFPPFRRYIRKLAEQDGSAAVQWWRRALQGHEKTTLAGSGSGQPARHSFEVRWSEEDTRRLNAMAAAERVTANHIVHVLWAVQVARRLFSQDVLFGAVVSGRPAEVPGIHEMIGLFINTLPVRVRLDGHTPLREIVQQRRDNAVAAEAQPSVPLAEIQQGRALFDHILVFENYPEGDAVLEDADGFQLEGVLAHEQTHYPLTLVVVPDEALLFRADLDADRIDPETVAHMLDGMVHLLRAWSRQPALTLSHGWSPAPTLPASVPLDDPDVLQAFAARVAETPAAVAVRFPGGSWTYQTLAARVAGLAQQLRSRRQVRPGDRIAIGLTRGPQLIQALLATLACGAAYVPLDPEAPRQRIHDLLDDAAPRLTISTPDLARKFDLADDAWLDPDKVTPETNPEWEPTTGDGCRPAYIMYTSGSTGKPKGVVVTRANLAWYLARARALYFDERPDAAMALFTATTFDLTVTTFFSPLTRGAAVVIPNAAPLDEQIHAVFAPGSGVQAVKMTPAHVALLEGLDRTEVAVVILGGEALKPEVVAQLRRRNPSMQIYNEYGPTEATVGCLVEAVDEGPISIGRPMTGVTTAVLDPWGQPLDADQTGELLLGGPGVAAGYHRQSALTEARFIRHQSLGRAYRTGDRVRRDHEGRFHFLGRIDHQLSLRGYRIEAGEVAQQLSDHPDISAAVVDVVHQDQGPRLTAWLRGKGTPENLRAFLSDRLPRYMIPEAWVFVEQFPLTANGKIDRAGLPAPSTNQTGRLPGNADERLLAGIWGAVLGLPADQTPAVDQDFFALGGDSIKALQIRARLRRAGYDLALKDLFREGTIARLAPLLKQDTPVQHRIDAGPVALSPIQAWFLGQKRLRPNHYNQSLLLRLPVDTDPAKLETAWRALVNHHRLLGARLDGGQLVVDAVSPDFWEHRSVAADTAQTTAASLQADLDLAAGPLFRALLLREPGADFLFLCGHHLVVDGVSWRILLDDVQDALSALANGESPQLAPVPTAFGDWTRYLQEQLLPTVAATESGYWQTLPAWREPLPLATQPYRVADRQRAARDLSPALSHRVLGPLHQRLGTEMNDILLTALVTAFQTNGFRGPLAITLEGHGRDVGSLDLSRTVGWFTAMYPVVFPEVDQLANRLEQVKATLRAVPGKGLGYGLLRFLAERDLPPLPRVLFNYLGRFDAAPALGEFLDAGAEEHGEEHLLFDFGFGAGVTQTEKGDVLTLFLDHHPARVSPEAAQTYLVAFADALQALADLAESSHGNRRLEEFPFAGLNQNALDQFNADPRAVDLYPATPMQTGLLFQADLARENGTAAYVSQLRLRLNQPLDGERLDQALTVLHQRHAVLRTRFVNHAGTPWQTVDRSEPVTARLLDLRGLAEADRALDAYAEETRLACAAPENARLCHWTRVIDDLPGDLILWTFHHALLDGWSVGIVLTELVQLYTLGTSPAPRPPFRDYLLWLAQRDPSAARAWWRGHLAGARQPTHLPLPIQHDEGWAPRAWVAEDSSELLHQLGETARAQRTTTNHLCSAIWCALLARLGQQNSITFGVVSNGRPAESPGADQMVGLFLTTLPVHVTLDADTTVARLADRLQDLAVKRENVGFLPSSEIQALSPLGPNLINHLVVFESYPVPETLSAGQSELRFETIDVEEWNHYDLSLVIVPGEMGRIRLEYNSARFADADVARLGERFCAWLAEAKDLIHQPLDRLAVPEAHILPRPEPRPISSAPATASDAITRAMTALWCAVLDRDQVDPDTSFFALGGHSLAAAKLNARIHDHFGVRLPLRAVFTQPTAAGLSALVRREQERGQSDTRIEPVAAAPCYPLPPAQQRILILARLDETGIAYNMPTAVEIKGHLDANALEQALADVVARHEILRTRFPERDGHPVQVIEANPPLPFQTLHCSPAEQENLLRENAEFTFDLAAGPLLRARLLCFSPNHHCFALNLHHLLGDAWSMDLLVRDILQRYQSHAGGEAQPLPTKHLQYKDVAAWLAARSDSDALAASRAFWLAYLADHPAPVSLPADRPRPLLQSHRGDRVMLNPPENLGTRLVAYATESGGTPFGLLLTALNLLVQATTGEGDLIIGTPVANRDHADLADQIGVLINTLALRPRLENQLPFAEAAAAVQRDLAQALAHQAYPFDRLVTELQGTTAARDHAGHGALFDIMLSLVQHDTKHQKNPGSLEVTPVESTFRTTKGDLSFDFLLEGNRLLGSIEYNSDLYDPATVARYGRHLLTLLDRLLAEPARPCALVDFLDADDHALLRAWSVGPAPAPCDASVLPALERTMRARADQIALHRNGRSLRYGEFSQRADSIAAALVQQGRVRPGDVVAVALPRDFDLPASLIALWRLGALYLPLDPSMPEERLRRILAEAKTRALITDEAGAERLRDHRYRTLVPPRQLVAEAPPSVRLTADTPAYLIFTSGSTGKPKGVLVTHGALAHTIGHARILFGFGENDRMPWVAPQAFDIALFELLVPLTAGACVDLLDREQVLDLERLGSAFKAATAFHAVPHLMERLLATLPEAGEGPRVLFTGGDRVPPALLQRLAARFPNTRIVELYGPTEAAVICSALEVNPYLAASEQQAEAAWRGACIGRPLPGISLWLRDDHGGLVPPGAVGEITIAGPTLARGYWRNAGADAAFVQRDRQRYYRTGDRARFLPDGNLAFLGRGDEQVQVRGFRVEPGEIAAVICQHPRVRAAVVMQQEGRLAAWLERHAEATPIAELRAFARARLPEYMVPEVWFLLETFPLNNNGKVDRAALRAMQTASEAVPEPIRQAPRTAAEHLLAEIWREVLGHDRFGINDHFADVGGHSLEVTRLAALIQQRFGRKVGIRALFSEPTIATLAAAEFADWHDETGHETIPTVPDAEDYPVSSEQARLWLLNQLPHAAAAHTIPTAVTLDGPLDIDVFAAALDDVVARHEIMRTRFIHTDRGLRQQVLPSDQAPRLAVMRPGPISDQERQILLAEQSQQVFNLAEAPPWRATLFVLGRERHLLFLQLHHILADAWSLGLLVQLWQAGYQSHLTGDRAQQAALPYQYHDYAVWQQQRLTGGSLAAAEHYWLEQFSEPPPALPLPTDKPRPRTRRFAGARITRQWSSATRDHLAAFAKTHNCSLFTVLIAAVNTLFHRTLGANDITLGVPFAQRDLPGSEEQLGLYYNNLALRTRFEGVSSFGALVRIVAANLQHAQEHGAYPYDHLLQKLRLPRDPGRNPLFDCMVKFERERQSDFTAMEGYQLRGVPLEPTTAHFDLTFSFHELDDGVTLILEYNPDLYLAERIEHLADSLERFVKNEVIEETPLQAGVPPQPLPQVNMPSKPTEPQATDPPPNPLERRLAAIWAEIIGCSDDEFEPNDDFFVCGGSSIQLAALARRYHQTFGVATPLATWFQITTPRGQTKHLIDAGVNPAAFLAKEHNP
ncbi:non-ribosomal peptide synthetase [Acanthopleuribacter pedis]|uniref:Amino acid adenylation domain-containing protein n=1 Tax=Acanthopleuribacter pedis TaxID=442870 RepID=A0A8J7PZC3_9BACT|nr:non-ribosomal peptide synthetase [Acanthopleuribacter pedis]MBO1317497.1 amino acid adenylation domain-containing protein [Acanthopleuribacter pedis]